MKILLIGQAPGRRGDSTEPLQGRIGEKLTALFGLNEQQYLEQFDRMNVLDFWPGRSGKGDKFPIHDAKRMASNKSANLSGRRILFIGIATASAFGFEYAPLKWRKFNGGRAAILPHPSGVNRWWNDPGNRKRASRFMMAIA